MNRHSDARLPDYLKSLPLYPLPHHAISRLTLALTRVKTPWFKNALIRWFADQYRVNWNEARLQRPQDFENFNAFFTRSLRDGMRPLEGEEDTVICPADGTISQIGRIDGQAIIQAKGHRFSVSTLLGADHTRAAEFENGGFITVYLSPRDYHRVHMPLAGNLRETVYVPGRLFSVAPHTVRTVPGLFARNERLATIFDSGAAGPMAVVLVGAINVAAIETVWDGLVTPPHRKQVETRSRKEAGIVLNRGDEMGRFNMGSTVILLFGKQRVRWLDELKNGQTVRMGQKIGLCESAPAGAVSQGKLR